jgi:hypothetical protein
MVNKQRQNSLTRIFLIFDNWCHRFWSFHHSIVGNIEVFGHTNTITILDLVFLSLAIVEMPLVAVVVGLFKYRIFESNNMK